MFNSSQCTDGEDGVLCLSRASFVSPLSVKSRAFMTQHSWQDSEATICDQFMHAIPQPLASINNLSSFKVQIRAVLYMDTSMKLVSHCLFTLSMNPVCRKHS